ncbi:hypothetical protein V1478_005195, partial [Vespula squamosa]
MNHKTRKKDSEWTTFEINILSRKWKFRTTELIEEIIRNCISRVVHSAISHPLSPLTLPSLSLNPRSPTLNLYRLLAQQKGAAYIRISEESLGPSKRDEKEDEDENERRERESTT